MQAERRPPHPITAGLSLVQPIGGKPGGAGSLLELQAGREGLGRMALPRPFDSASQRRLRTEHPQKWGSGVRGPARSAAVEVSGLAWGGPPGGGEPS